MAAACAVGLPLIILVLYAALEVNLLFAIRTNLDLAVRRGAQGLISNYVATGVPAAAQSSGNLPSGVAFDIPTSDGHYFVKSTANQFTWTWDLTVRPATVTVTVSYPTASQGNNALMPFPSPNPLNIDTNKFTILTSGTFPVPSPS
jgi:hypothetical protein